MPSEADLDEIFVIADKDKSGAVDEQEFAMLYALIKSGEVAGLSAMGAGVHRERIERAVRQASVEAAASKNEAEAELRQRRVQERMRAAAAMAKRDAEAERDAEARRRGLEKQQAEAESQAAAAAAEREESKRKAEAIRARLKADLKAKKDAAVARKTTVAFGATTAAAAEAEAKAAEAEAAAAAKAKVKENAMARVREKMASSKEQRNRLHERAGSPDSGWAAAAAPSSAGFSNAAAGLREALSAARQRSLSRDRHDVAGRTSVRISYEDTEADSWAGGAGSRGRASPGGAPVGAPSPAARPNPLTPSDYSSPQGARGPPSGPSGFQPALSPRSRPVVPPGAGPEAVEGGAAPAKDSAQSAQGAVSGAAPAGLPSEGTRL